jgi:hypothetical protein
MDAQTMETETDPTTSAVVANTHQYPNTPSRKYTIPAYRIELDTAKSPSTREQIYAGPTTTEPNFLTTLPLEIVLRILNCMWPEEYAGLACTCRFALELTNDQIQIKGPHLSGQFDDSDYEHWFSQSMSLAIACRMVRGWERQVEGHVNCTKCGLHFSESEEDTDEEDEDDEDDDGNNIDRALEIQQENEH